MIQITFLSENRTVQTPEGCSLLDVMRREGIFIDAPCAGRGICGKCLVSVDGLAPQRACRTFPDKDIVVDTTVSSASGFCRIDSYVHAPAQGDAAAGTDYLAAFDLGTTTVAGFLLRASDGAVTVVSSCGNPQAAYGADVISRINEALTHGSAPLTSCIRKAVDRLLSDMAARGGISPKVIRQLAIAGNTCMHHLFLGIPTASLSRAPCHPAVKDAMSVNAASLSLHAGPQAEVYFPPNIAGFVGGDTVACMVAERLDREDNWTLLLDIGTNGEIVLGCRNRLIACSAAAGPAFEGAGISCGMRAEEGAVNHALWSEGTWRLETIGRVPPVGICGSGLLDAAASLLKSAQMDETGLLLKGRPVVLADESASGNGKRIELTQKDIRQLQLAKGAIRAGISLLCEEAGITPDKISKVLLAGAFGSFLSPESACVTGLIPPVLRSRIRPVGNAAGDGAKMMALSVEERKYAQDIAAKTEYLELAAVPRFQDAFAEAMSFTDEEEMDALI